MGSTRVSLIGCDSRAREAEPSAAHRQQSDPLARSSRLGGAARLAAVADVADFV
jgi:hypothetical protein